MMGREGEEMRGRVGVSCTHEERLKLYAPTVSHNKRTILERKEKVKRIASSNDVDLVTFSSLLEHLPQSVTLHSTTVHTH